MLFGKKIRELRDENGVLQRQLAALLEMPHNFTDEELYKIEEAVKLLVELNCVTRMEVLSISRKKEQKQTYLKNFCWNIANLYGIYPKRLYRFCPWITHTNL